MQAELARRGDIGWTEGTALAVRIYQDSYGATIPAHADELVIVRDRAGKVVAAAGLRDAVSGLFSQTYLDKPAHQIASSALDQEISAAEIIEVGTLVSEAPRAVMPLIEEVIRIGQGRGKRVSLFTATAHLRRLLRFTCLRLIDLGAARADRVADPAAWGSYYDTDPRVCLIPDPGLVLARRSGPEAA